MGRSSTAAWTTRKRAAVKRRALGREGSNGTGDVRERWLSRPRAKPYQRTVAKLAPHHAFDGSPASETSCNFEARTQKERVGQRA
jgi:hypothetical protein